MYIKPFSTELLGNEKKKQEMTCNFRVLRGCFACPGASLNQMITSHMKSI